MDRKLLIHVVALLFGPGTRCLRLPGPGLFCTYFSWMTCRLGTWFVLLLLLCSSNKMGHQHHVPPIQPVSNSLSEGDHRGLPPDTRRCLECGLMKVYSRLLSRERCNGVFSSWRSGVTQTQSSKDLRISYWSCLWFRRGNEVPGSHSGDILLQPTPDTRNRDVIPREV